MKVTFDITGMSCAACSARVQKAALSVTGVIDANVNLLKNSMAVVFDDERIVNEDRRRAAVESVCFAVTKSGYGASEHVGLGFDARSLSADKRILRRLIASVCLALPVFYAAMGSMLSWPLPFDMTSVFGMLAVMTIEFVLTVVVMCVNGIFFKSGFRALFNLSPNMDSLVALGAAASFVFSFVIYVQAMVVGIKGGSPETVMDCMHHLYFDCASVILTLITVGKYFAA
ncbi:MAG: cation-translocating P-type ATPase, partial [Eggerthellaceae bacterium]|nr:cation-translocating P-type ATPase [Eggerthellaceae bacterium]